MPGAAEAAELSLNARASTHGLDAAAELSLNASASTLVPDAAWPDVEVAEATPSPSPDAAALLKRCSLNVASGGSIRLRAPLAGLSAGVLTGLLRSLA